MSSSVFELFDEYAAAYARGERPSAEEYLERAGVERDQLAQLLDEFLRRAPIRQPSEDDVRNLGLLLAEEPPLLVLRRERKLRREQVVEMLHERLGLAPELREKLGLRYHELETGQLEATRVDRRVWNVLSELFQARVDEIAAWGTRAPARTEIAFFRAAELPAPRAAAASSSASEIDEVDRLFGLS